MTTPPPSPLATPLPWDLVSAAYAEEAVEHFQRYAQDALALAEVRSGERILDVATGPGTLALIAARSGPVSAIDFSAPMIALLRERAAAAGVQVDAQVGDGMALPYAEGGFDAAFSMFGLMFFPDRLAGLRELFRVLRPGGRAVISSWVPMDQVPVLAGIFEALQEELPALPFPKGKAPLGEASELIEELTAAGFRDLRVETRTHAVETASMESFFLGMRRGNAPFALLKLKLGDEKWEAVSAGVLSRLQDRFGNGPQRVEFTANLALGVR